MTDWYCKIRDRRYGPMASGKLKRLAASGELGPQDWVRRAGDRTWARASSVRGLFVPRDAKSAAEPRLGDESSSPAEAAQRKSRWRPSSRDWVGLVAMCLSLTLLLGSLWYTFGRSTGESFDSSRGGMASGLDPQATIVPSAEVRESAGGRAADPLREPAEESACSEDQALGEAKEDGEVAPVFEAPSDGESDSSPPTPAEWREAIRAEEPGLEVRPGGDAASPPLEPLAVQEPILDPVADEPPPVEAREAEGEPPAKRPRAVTSARPQDSFRANELFDDSPPAAGFPGTAPKDHPLIPEEPGPVAAAAEQQLEAANVRGEQRERYREELQQLVSRTRRQMAERAVAGEELLKVQSEIDRTQAALQESMLRMSALTSQIEDLQFEINNPRISPQARNQLRSRARNLIEQLQAMAAIRDNTEQQLERVLPMRLAEVRGKIAEIEQKSDVLLPEWIAISDPLGNQSAAIHAILIEASSRWLEESSEFLPAYLMRGVAHWHRGDPDSALGDLNQVVEGAARGAKTDHQREVLAVALSVRAVVHAEREQEARARADFVKANEFHPNSLVVSILRGRANVALGRSRAARDDFLRAIRLDNQDPTGFRKLAWLLANSSSPDSGKGAAYYARIACELTDWNHWQSLDAYALANAAEGNFERAIEVGQRARDGAPPEVRPGIEQRLKLYQAGVAPTNVRQR